MAKVKAELIWFDGKLIPWEQATVHVMSHALHYGSSVFEGIRAYQTHNGCCFFRLEDHIQRLFNSAKIYRMHIPYTPAQVVQACKDTLKANKLQSAYLRPLAFLGDIGVGIRVPQNTSAQLMIAAFQWDAYLGEQAINQGIKVGVSSWHRLAPNTMPTAAKAGGNYLSSQLITMEAQRHGYDEGIAMDINNTISEGAGQNLFIVRNNIIYTPPASASILSGLTRDCILQLAQKLGLEVREETISRDTLYLADEFFMTGTATEIVPVIAVDGLPVGDGTRGKVTQALQEKFFGLFTGKTPDNWGWLTSLH